MADKFSLLISEVKSRGNIVDMCTSRGVEVHQSGVRYKALCPFHDEKTPSFVVDENTQTYHCFGCGERGDIISFVQKFDNTDFMDAVRLVAENAGMNDIDNKIDAVFSSGFDSAVDYRMLRSCMQAAADFYRDKFNALKSTHPAKKMVESRGVSLPDIDCNDDNENGKDTALYLGYCGAKSTELVEELQSRGFTPETLVQCGLAREVTDKDGDKVVLDFFSNRLLFAFHDNSGRIIGFSGRKLKESDFGGKYINTPETPLFHKGSAIFNFHAARTSIGRESLVYIVEGQFDVYAMRESGVDNVVAVSGTAVTDTHIKTLTRAAGAQGKLVFCLDGDKAGRASMVKSVQNHLAVQQRGESVVFPKGQDPCDVYVKHGAKSLEKYVNVKRKTAAEFIARTASKYARTAHVDNSPTEELSNEYLAQEVLNELSALCAPVVSANPAFVRMCASIISPHILIPADDIVRYITSGKKKENVFVKKSHKDEEGETLEFIPEDLARRFTQTTGEDCKEIEKKYKKLRDDRHGGVDIRIFALVARMPGLWNYVTQDKKDKTTYPVKYKVSKNLLYAAATMDNRRGAVAESYGKLAPLVACIFFDDSLLPALHNLTIDDLTFHLEYLVSLSYKLAAQEKKKKDNERIVKFLIENENLSVHDMCAELKKENMLPHLINH